LVIGTPLSRFENGTSQCRDRGEGVADNTLRQATRALTLAALKTMTEQSGCK